MKVNISDFLSQLDPEQRRAAESSSPRILVTAGPGSGKTRVLAARFANLLNKGADPSSILAVTFTNRAANEMKERIGRICGPGRLNIGTFHAFALNLIKKERPGMRLLGREESEAILDGLGVKNAGKAAERISAIKNRALSANDEDIDVMERYGARLKEIDAFDLDDLIIGAAQLIEKKPPLLDHVMIDEYQDINPLQEGPVSLLSRQAATLLAIGDPDQSIYAFRGSSLKSFLDFERDYPGAEVVSLSRNYRSRAKIVEVSRALIKNNSSRIDYEAQAMNAGGEIKTVECPDEKNEAAFIAKEIETLMGGLTSLTAGSHMEGARFSDFAVLFRTNRQADAIRESLERASIPCQVIGAKPTGFGGFLRHLDGKGAPPDMPLSEFINAEGASAGIEKEVAELFSRAAANLPAGNEGLIALLDGMRLSAPADDYDVAADKVSVMTLHAAKGLEFRVVFIAGVEDGLLPLRFKGGETDIEEERRLFYVGMTRAKERLYMLNAGTRTLWGELKTQRPSPFLKEMPEGLVRKMVVEKKAPKRRAVQTGLFD